MNRRLLEECVETMREEGDSLTFKGGNGILGDMKDNDKKTLAETIADEMRAEEGELLMEMAHVVDMSGGLVVYVRSKELRGGNTPHFHVFDAASHGKDRRSGFHTCVEIRRPAYFFHEGKRDLLNASMRDELCAVLSAPHRRFTQYTNWDFLINEWNQNNAVQVPIDTPMPDYHNIVVPEG